MRNVGAPAPPLEGPAKTVLAFWLTNAPVNVPDPVTGELEIEKTEAGNASPTLVTVPVAGDAQLITPAAVELSTIPLDDGEVLGSV